mgnify:CR=1 FL=1
MEPTQHQAVIAKRIITTATERGPDKSTCPSEIARMLFPDDWRDHMKAVLGVAIDLVRQGKVMITKKGEAVDINNIKGAVRIKIV